MTTIMKELDGLELRSRPVAIGFLSTPPSGMTRIDRSLAASCSYWKHASEGHAFYTLPEDHYSCPVGAHTHNVALPDAQKRELEGLIGTMIELRYLRSDEIASIPQRRDPFQIAAYAPLDVATFSPDVVVVRGNARQLMLVSEAARAAGAFDGSDIMGRPACGMLPQAIATRTAVASFGCIGNRVYTGLEDDELYVAIPAAKLRETLVQLDVVLHANNELRQFHEGRLRASSEIKNGLLDS